MKLKVGTIVKLVPISDIGRYRIDVRPLFYKTTVITNIVDDRYEIQLDNGQYLWYEDELKPLGRLLKLKRVLG